MSFSGHEGSGLEVILLRRSSEALPEDARVVRTQVRAARSGREQLVGGRRIGWEDLPAAGARTCEDIMKGAKPNDERT